MTDLLQDPSVSQTAGDSHEAHGDHDHQVENAMEPQNSAPVAETPVGVVTPGDEPPLAESHLTQAADILVLVMFVVGVYAQIFSLCLYAFGSSA